MPLCAKPKAFQNRSDLALAATQEHQMCGGASVRAAVLIFPATGLL